MAKKGWLAIFISILIVNSLLISNCSFSRTDLTKKTSVSVSQLLPKESRYGIILKGEWHSWEIKALDQILDKNILTKEVIASIKNISIHDYNPCPYLDSNHAACCHNREICIKTRYLSYYQNVLEHEMAHAFTQLLKEKSHDFENEWKEVAGNVYNKKLNTYPSNGLITEHKEKIPNYQEDVAEYIEEIAHMIKDPNYCLMITRLPKIKDEPRYRKKLDLLKKWKFITEETYKKVSLYFPK